MRIFLAGATGVIGSRLLPMLIEDGHEVVAMTRTETKAKALREAGAMPVVADGLDRDAVVGAIEGAGPEVVVGQQTALSGKMDLKHFDRWFAQTNRLRTQGTEHLLEGARRAGARRLIVQSYAGWPAERTGAMVKSEEDPFDPDPPRWQLKSLAAIRRQEELVTRAEGVEGLVLRYGALTGRGTGMAAEAGSTYHQQITARKFPVIGGGTGVWSFCHVHDAATATVAALDRGRGGQVYNVVDDEPVAVNEWLPGLAKLFNAKPPQQIPAFIGRLAVGEVGLSMMTRVRGATNSKAKLELDWAPRYRSFRQGLAD